jgi:hypothetical protein
VTVQTVTSARNLLRLATAGGTPEAHLDLEMKRSSGFENAGVHTSVSFGDAPAGNSGLSSPR